MENINWYLMSETMNVILFCVNLDKINSFMMYAYKNGDIH